MTRVWLGMAEATPDILHHVLIYSNDTNKHGRLGTWLSYFIVDRWLVRL